jgi:hypothetical protein
MEGIVFMVMNGTWKTPVHGLVISEWRGWAEFRVEGRKDYGERERMERDKLT